MEQCPVEPPTLAFQPHARATPFRKIRLQLASDSSCVCMSETAVAASPILQTLISDDLEDTCHDQPVIFPFESGCGAAATRHGLQEVVKAFNPGGFPLALRWQHGETERLATAVATFNCAQFLDMPILTSAARDEFAVALAVRCANVDEVSQIFDAGEPIASSDANLDQQQRILLLPSAISLGDRGRRFLSIWLSGKSSLAHIPCEGLGQILARANTLMYSDLGVAEILYAAPGVESGRFSEDIAIGRRVEASDKKADNKTELPDGFFVSDLVRAIDVVMARSDRYLGSSVVTEALVIHSRSERNLPFVRVRAVEALAKIASRGDVSVSDALRDIIMGSNHAGMPNSEEEAFMEDTRDVVSPAKAAARRMRLDAAWQVRVAACEALVSTTCVADAKIVDVLVSAARHAFFKVRLAAVNALSRTGDASNHAAAAAFVSAIGDEDWRVRDAAVEALSSLYAPGTDGAVTAFPDASDSIKQLVPTICELVGHRSADIRQTARSAISVLARRSRPSSVTQGVLIGLTTPVSTRRVPVLRRPIAAVRQVAVEILGDRIRLFCGEPCSSNHAAHPQESEAENILRSCLREVVRLLGDRSPIVRQSAAIALGCFGRSSPLPQSVRCQICQIILDECQICKIAHYSSDKLEVLKANAEKGNPAAITLALDALSMDTAEPEVHCAAVSLLDSLALPGDSSVSMHLLRALRAAGNFPKEDILHAIHNVCSGSPNEVEEVARIAADESIALDLRRQALQCLGKLATVGDVAAMGCAEMVLQGSKADLRAEALGVIVRVGVPGDAAARALVAAHLHDKDLHVRRCAIEGCEKVLRYEDTDVIEALVEHVVNAEFCLRQVAVKTLSRGAPGHPLVISSLLRSLDKGHWPQRQGALSALPDLASRGDEVTLSAVVQRVTDSAETCRQTACEVLARLACVGDEVAFGALLQRLHDQSWLVRVAAAVSLAKIATPSQVERFDAEVSTVADDVKKMVTDAFANTRSHHC